MNDRVTSFRQKLEQGFSLKKVETKNNCGEVIVTTYRIGADRLTKQDLEGLVALGLLGKRQSDYYSTE